jgi:sugar phosphate isomerase/epimerase
MKSTELSVSADDLHADIKAALDRARKIGFRRVDASAVQGALSPKELSRSGQRHLIRHLSDLGITLGSLRGPVGGPGFADGAGGERRLDTTRNILGLAAQLRIPTVSIALGRPADAAPELILARTREALLVLADDADRLGVALTIETAGAPVRSLASLLAEINCPNLAACCDSGAMLMQGENPHQIGELLPGRVRHVRARDAISGTPDAAGHETALGEGHLDPAAFLASLAEAGFAGDIVLSRTTGGDAARELAKAREAFASLLL